MGLLACGDRDFVRPLWIDDADILKGLDGSNSHTRTLSFEINRKGKGWSARGESIASPLVITHATITGTCDLVSAHVAGQSAAERATSTIRTAPPSMSGTIRLPCFDTIQRGETGYHGP
ncbi:hypothetical protein FPV16_24035 [Methylobacterium sp. W2]|uniref:hypothetical protein n=1 Tax=Methylobacterium sp. W2 TaxID=2598107 RepID=UPI001D0C1E40|nr:hypothetical protein [Methylobacterium sp. W2]MCC0809230.1 hypothetical protein [Methylobacterium sp. W2]